MLIDGFQVTVSNCSNLCLLVVSRQLFLIVVILLIGGYQVTVTHCSNLC